MTDSSDSIPRILPVVQRVQRRGKELERFANLWRIALIATFVLTLLDVTTHRLTVVNAGHMTPMIRRANGAIEVVGEAEVGVPLGIEPDTAFPTAETQLGPGDVVVLYTDGVSEAVGQKERFFGIDGLRATLEATRGGAAEVGDAVLRALRSHVGNRTQSDDIALVCFGRTD